MEPRERIIATLNFEEPDRVGFIDFIWAETWKEWRSKGLPPDYGKYVDFDIILVDVDQTPRFEKRVLEETERWMIYVDEMGTKWRWPKFEASGPPLPLEGYVKSEDDFESIKGRLDPDDPERYPKNFEENIRLHHEKGKFVALALWEPFDYCWRLRGFTQLLMDMVNNPAFVREMFNFIANFQIRLASRAIDAGVDGIWLWDDICYKNGPFFSPETYEKTLLPAQRKMVEFFEKKGLPCIYHTDGNIMKIIDSLIKTGIRAIHPLECKAGNDALLLKEKYCGSLVLMGNIDVRALASDVNTLKGEVLSKLDILLPGGGYIASSDHSIPPNVSFHNFLLFVKIVRKHGIYKPC
ncbi:MAG: uroporphyrinogen decarboxylase family protein [Candidatus Bathyarchaeia archaeon]